MIKLKIKITKEMIDEIIDQHLNSKEFKSLSNKDKKRIIKKCNQIQI